MYKVIIEIPKGSDRRIHMSYENKGFKDFGPIKEKIPINDGVMPVCYGYLVDFVNELEKDNVDCLVFTTKNLNTGDEVEVEVIGIMKRDDGDHKIFTKDETVSINTFEDLPEQEIKLIKEYFGYKKQLFIEGRDKAIEYLQISKSSSNIIH
jgi:inorganic pyrophosphatase